MGKTTPSLGTSVTSTTKSTWLVLRVLRESRLITSSRKWTGSFSPMVLASSCSLQEGFSTSDVQPVTLRLSCRVPSRIRLWRSWICSEITKKRTQLKSTRTMSTSCRKTSTRRLHGSTSLLLARSSHSFPRSRRTTLGSQSTVPTKVTRTGIEPRIACAGYPPCAIHNFPRLAPPTLFWGAVHAPAACRERHLAVPALSLPVFDPGTSACKEIWFDFLLHHGCKSNRGSFKRMFFE